MRGHPSAGKIAFLPAFRFLMSLQTRPEGSFGESMQQIVTIIGPVFGLIAIGYAIGRTRLMTPEGVKGLTNFVFYSAIPALLFRSMARTALPRADDLVLIVTYFTTLAVVFIVAMLIAHLVFRLNLADQGLFAMGAIFGNTVLAGIPIVYAAFGEAGLVPLLLIIVFHPTMIFPVVTLIIEASQGKGGGTWRTIHATAHSLVTNPVIVALLSGIAWNAIGFGIPEAIDSFLKLLGGAAAPAALFALGATLTRFKLASGLSENLVMSVIKLAVLPVTMWFSLTTFTTLPPLWISVAVLTAALPTGANVFLLAQRYDVYVARTSTLVLASTAVSALTLSFVLIWLGVSNG